MNPIHLIQSGNKTLLIISSIVAAAAITALVLIYTGQVDTPDYKASQAKIKQIQAKQDSVVKLNKVLQLDRQLLLARLDSSPARQAAVAATLDSIQTQYIYESDIDTSVGLDSLAARLNAALQRIQF